MTAPPHPIPYQGSKRLLAPRILAAVAGCRFERLWEPFAGSAALTIAARRGGLAAGYVIADSLAPLARLWERVLAEPDRLAAEYEALWAAADFDRVRGEYNRSGGSGRLLYLLARCVSNAPRWNARGEFNQAPDRRRRGMHPRRMRAQLGGASALLRAVTAIRCADFETTLADARPGDLVYLDPPWQGVSTGRDHRYHAGLERARLLAALEDLNRRGIAWLLSYDGRHGERAYGEPLPAGIAARRVELPAGRSAQATLHGRVAVKVESLYVSVNCD